MYTATKLFVAIVCTCALTTVARADDAEKQFDLAAGHYSAQRWEQAAEEFRTFIREYPYHAKLDKAMYYQGESLMQCKRYTEAYPVFVELLAEHPNSQFARQSLFRSGESALLGGNFEEGRMRLMQFNTQYPEDKLNALVLMYQAEMALQGNDTTGAAKLYRQSIVHFSDQPVADECRLGLAHCLELQKQSEGAEAILREVAQHDHSPWAELATIKLAEASVAAGNHQQALELYDSVVQRFPNSSLVAEAMLGRGRALYQVGRYDDAQRDLSELSTNKELGTEARQWLALVQKAKKQYNVAADTLSSTLQNNRSKMEIRTPVVGGPAVATSPDGKGTEIKVAPQPEISAAAESSSHGTESQMTAQISEELAADKQHEKPVIDKTPIVRPVVEQPAPTKAAEEKVVEAKPSTKTPVAEAPVAEKPAEKPSMARAMLEKLAPAKLTASKLASARPVAEANLTNDEQQHRNAAAARYQAAEVLIRAGDYNRAITTLQANDNAAEDPQSLANQYLTAIALQCLKRTDESQAILNELTQTLDRKLAGYITDQPEEPSPVSSPLSANDLTALKALRSNVILARATTLVAADKYAEAITPLQEYLAMGRQDVGSERAQAALIICLARTNRIDEARQALDDFRGKHSDSNVILPTIYQVAEAAYAAGNYPVAAELFTALAAEGNPPESIAKGLAGIGHSRAQMGDYEAAERMFAQFLEHYPNDTYAAEVALAHGQVLERLGHDTAAASVYRQALAKYKQSPQLPAILCAAAHLHDRMGEDEEAVRLYQQLVHDYPNRADMDATLYGMAWALRDLGRGNESDKVFRQLHQEYRESRFWADATFRLAERASQRGDRAAAGELIKPLFDGKCPAKVLEHALYLQAQLAIAERRWADAQPALERLIAEYPNSDLKVPAEFWFAECAYRSDDLVNAEKRFDTLAEHITSHNERWTAVVPLRRAQLLVQEKKWKEAREMAESIAKDYADFDQQYEVDYLVGRCLMAEEAYDDARLAFSKVVHSIAGGKTESAAMAQWMIGESYFHQQNYQQALKEYLRVEMLYSYPRWQAAALLQAGKCQEQLGQTKEAAELYAHLLDKFPQQTEFTADASERLKETTRQ